MTSLSDFPPDVQAAAEIAVFAFETRIQSGDFANPDGTEARDALKAEFANVIAAEREACAVRAEALERGGYEWVRESLWAHIKRDTAADIRRPRNPSIISTPAS